MQTSTSYLKWNTIDNMNIPICPVGFTGEFYKCLEKNQYSNCTISSRKQKMRERLPINFMKLVLPWYQIKQIQYRKGGKTHKNYKSISPLNKMQKTLAKHYQIDSSL